MLSKHKKSHGVSRAASTTTLLNSTAQHKYNQLCKKKCVKADATLLAALSSNNINVAVDILDVNELDAVLDFMQKHSKASNLKVTAGTTVLTRELKSKLERQGLDKPICATTQGATKIARAISAVMLKSDKLTLLQISGIHLHSNVFKLLAKGINHSSLLRNVDLAGAKLGDSGITAIIGALNSCAHLQSLNLSNCELTDKSAKDIGQIVKLHGARRDEKCWTNSLRGRTSSTGHGDGLSLINLSQNEYTDKGVEILGDSLIHDKWLLGVNLSKNKIGPKGVVSVVELLRTNSTLLVYALNDNENLDSRLVEFVENSLEKRIKSDQISLSSLHGIENIMSILKGWAKSKFFDALQNLFVNGNTSSTKCHTLPVHVGNLSSTQVSTSTGKEAVQVQVKALQEKVDLMSISLAESEARNNKLAAENAMLRAQIAENDFKSLTVIETQRDDKVEQQILLELETSIVKLTEKVHQVEQNHQMDLP